MSKPLPSTDSPWPHRVALALCCATFPLLWVGGLVTTTKAGMAVPDWPSTYGYNLFLYPWTTWLYGPWDLFIEHGHRLFGALVGMIAIVFVLVAWLIDSRPWLRWLSLAALALVIFQGVLGGMRVVMNERLLAMAHGCVGPLFFALSVALAVWTSPGWNAARDDDGSSEVSRPSLARLHRLAWLTTILTYLQLLLGAGLRHLPADAPAGVFQALVWLHLAMAAGLLVHVALVVVAVLREFRASSNLLLPAGLLALLMVVQLGLGASTWVLKYSWPTWVGAIASPPEFVIEAQGWWQTHIVTAHVAVGSMILVTALRVALWSSSPQWVGAELERPAESRSPASPDIANSSASADAVRLEVAV